PRIMLRVACRLPSTSSDWPWKVSPAGVRRVGDDERSTRSSPAQASSAWMRRENAGCVTCLSCAEREKLRVSARLTKSSSHLVSMNADYVRAPAARPLDVDQRVRRAAPYWLPRFDHPDHDARRPA